MPRARRKPPSVYVVEAIITAVAENSMDIMTATNVMFSLFNANPQNGDEDNADAEAVSRRGKKQADRVGADRPTGAGDVLGDKF